MNALRELLAVFDIDVDPDHNLEKGHEKVEGFEKKLKEVVKTVAEVFGAEKLYEFVKGEVEVNAHLQDMATRLDVSATLLRSFGIITQDVGIDADSAARSLGFLEKNLGEAATKGGQSAATFARLGVATKDAHGNARPLVDVLGDVAEGIAKLPDQNARAAASMEIFGREGRSLVPILARGREGMQELLEEADALGNGLGDEFYADVKQAADGFEHFEHVIRSLKDRALAAILPAVTELGEVLEDSAKWVLELDKDTHLLQAAFVTMAIVVGVLLVDALVTATAAAWALVAPFVVGFAVPIAIVGALVWIFQDLYKAIKGGHSVIANLIEQLGGVGAKTSFLKTMNRLWEDGTKLVNDLAYALGYFLGVWEQFGIEIAKSKAGKWFGAEVLDELERVGKMFEIAASAAEAFLAALEAIPKALQNWSTKPITAAIDHALDPVLAGVFDAGKGTTSAAEHGVPQSMVDEWNRHNGPATKDPRSYSAATQRLLKRQELAGVRDKNPAKLSPETHRLLARLAVADPTNAAHGGTVIHEGPISVTVNTKSDKPKEVGEATGEGVSTARQKDRRNTLTSVVKP
jgi:Phage-related minor tail protein